MFRKRSMLNFLRYALLAVFLLAVALVSALTSMRIAIHGREVVTPNLIGMSPEQAEQQAIDNGLLVQVEGRFYSPFVPAGHILSQNPAAGTKVRRGWRLRLAESLGQQHVAIPDVTGQSLRSAEMNLRRRGLEPGPIAYLSLPSRAPDQVISQSPAADAVGIASPKVGLLVTPRPKAPEYIMPNLIGASMDQAVRTLEAAGIKVRRNDVAALSQAPGSTAFLPESLKPASSKMDAPGIAPEPLRLAEPLTPTSSGSATNAASSRSSGLVVSQTPAPGTKITSGSMVELQVR
ncbi:MAG: PASTA domain-containing protein [Candidatus Korobacteraceae bacterium]